MGEIARYRGSNLPSPVAAGLSTVTVQASKRYAPWVFAGVGAVAAGVLMGHVGHDPVPMFIQGLPVVGGAVTHGLQAIGGAVTGVEHLPLVTPAIYGAAGYVGYKTIGKPVQRKAQGLVRKHGLE